MTEQQKKIARLIRQKSGIEWNPEKEFKSFNDALDFSLLVESNSKLIVDKIVPINEDEPFGKQRVKITTLKEWLSV